MLHGVLLPLSTVLGLEKPWRRGTPVVSGEEQLLWERWLRMSALCRLGGDTAELCKTVSGPERAKGIVCSVPIAQNPGGMGRGSRCWRQTEVLIHLWICWPKTVVQAERVCEFQEVCTAFGRDVSWVLPDWQTVLASWLPLSRKRSEAVR